MYEWMHSKETLLEDFQEKMITMSNYPYLKGYQVKMLARHIDGFTQWLTKFNPFWTSDYRVSVNTVIFHPWPTYTSTRTKKTFLKNNTWNS